MFKTAGLIALGALLVSAGAAWAATPSEMLIEAGTSDVSVASGAASVASGAASVASGAASAASWGTAQQPRLTPTSTAVTREATLSGGDITGTIQVRKLSIGGGELVLQTPDIDRDDVFTVRLYSGADLPVTADRELHRYTRDWTSHTSGDTFVIEMTPDQLQMWETAQAAHGGTIKVIQGTAHGDATFAG